MASERSSDELAARRSPISAEGEHRLDGVAVMGQLSAHMEGEVDLGRSRLFELHQGAAVAGVRPVSTFAFSRVATSSSAVCSAAAQA